MGRKKCRLWWPEQLLTCKPTSSFFIFGWYMPSGNSLDIVVAGAVPSEKISHFLIKNNLEELLSSVDKSLPTRLHESSSFSIIGHCSADCSDKSLKALSDQNDDCCSKNTEELHFLEPEEKSHAKGNTSDSTNGHLDQDPLFEVISGESFKRWSCDCKKLDQFYGPFGLSSITSACWILLFCKPQTILSEKIKWIPEFHHIHQNGHVFSCDIHITIYELPIYGISHLSLSSWGHSCFYEHVTSLVKKPNWFKEVQNKPMLLDLGSILLALNCASSAIALLEQSMGTFNPVNHWCISMLLSIIWNMIAVFLASISTMMYIFLQFFHKLYSHGPNEFFFMLQKMFMHTWKNVHMRSCQFLYWPIFLQDAGFSSQSNVEYLHQASLKKHFILSNVVMDIVFGIVLGVILLKNVEDICFWISVIAHQMTENLLRSGCVWLMGVPAGFKLNNELAELLGAISLNAIQIYSTLWVFLGTFCKFAIKMLALSGVLFGSTVPTALCVDMLKLATLHVSFLHWLISLFYSEQIQSLTSLWRLFRGRKLNPLRQRLDSYDYTVEQHVVGSLLFIPLLLLLPTTSVFYVFFTSLCTTITFICISFEITISVLHATPYADILLWFMRKRSFPSGIWFNIIYRNHEVPDETGFAKLDKSKEGCFIDGGSETLIFLLNSNYATLVQVVAPYYGNIFRGVSPSFAKSMTHGILSGKRFPYTLHTRLPPTMPWMQIGCNEYWKLCYNALISSRL